MTERKLATIRTIHSFTPIEGADKIELARVDGWQVVVKKGEYQLDQMVVYLEVDSWVPHSVAPFLTKPGQFPKVYEGVEGQRLKTIKLRGALSQGLILPLSALAVKTESGSYIGVWEGFEGHDVTARLGILKWEKPMSASMQGFAKGNFPAFLRKTDQERIQNLSRNLETGLRSEIYEVTEKLHGTSCTFALQKTEDGFEFFVCSRNMSLKTDEENASNLYVKMANDLNIKEKLQTFFDAQPNAPIGSFIAFQGEIVGPGINGNQYGLTAPEFYLFDVQGYFGVDSAKGYCPPVLRQLLAESFEIKHVPVIHESYMLTCEDTVQSLLNMSEGKSSINGSNREGLVFKRTDVESNNVSWKCVSNSWLLGGGEDQ